MLNTRNLCIVIIFIFYLLILGQLQLQMEYHNLKTQTNKLDNKF